MLGLQLAWLETNGEKKLIFYNEMSIMPLFLFLSEFRSTHDIHACPTILFGSDLPCPHSFTFRFPLSSLCSTSIIMSRRMILWEMFTSTQLYVTVYSMSGS